MLLQKIKDYFLRFNYFLKKILIPKILKVIMIISLFITYTFVLGLTAIFLRLLKPRLLKRTKQKWQDAHLFSTDLAEAQRQS